MPYFLHGSRDNLRGRSELFDISKEAFKRKARSHRRRFKRPRGAPACVAGCTKKCARMSRIGKNEANGMINAAGSEFVGIK